MDIKGKTALLERVSFELKYRHGFAYLDKCGRTLNAITRERPQWALRGAAPNAQVTALANLENGCTLNFSSESVVSSIERPRGKGPLESAEITDFSEQADWISRIVIDQLGVNEFTRTGCRFWYLFACADLEEAERWILDLGFYSVPPTVCAAFKGQIKEYQFDHNYRREGPKFSDSDKRC
jgi:hypothetical protein